MPSSNICLFKKKNTLKYYSTEITLQFVNRVVIYPLGECMEAPPA